MLRAGNSIFAPRRFGPRRRRRADRGGAPSFRACADYDDGHDVLRRARLALDRFSELQVDLILGGHLHRGYIGNSLDVYPSKDRSSGIVIVHSGTSTSRRGRAREREKNSFNLIQIDGQAIRVTHFMFFDELGDFAPISRHEFPRRNRHYLDGGEALRCGRQ